MSDIKVFHLGERGNQYRKIVAQQVLDADDNAITRIGPCTRTLEQNAKYYLGVKGCAYRQKVAQEVMS